MSELQQEAVTLSSKESKRIQALKRLDAARKEIWQHLPNDFDPEKELEEARAERFSNALSWSIVAKGTLRTGSICLQTRSRSYKT